MLCDNFSGFACWVDLILSEFKNPFCACLAQPGEKYESRLMFNIKMPVLFQVGYCVLLTTIKINYILRLLMTSMLYYMLGEDDV